MYGIIETDGARHNRRTSRSSVNESVSSSVSFGVLLGLFFVCIAHLGSYKITDSKPMKLLWAIIYGQVFIATMMIIVICVCIYRKREMTLTAIQSDFSVNIELVFLWIFGLCMSLENFVALAQDFECWIDLSSVFYLMSIFGRFIKSTFIFLQLGFISYFKNSTFLCVSGFKFCMYFIILVNLSIWLREIQRNVQNIVTPPIRLNFTDAIISNMSYPTDGIFCVFHSEIYPLYLTLSPYLKPTIFQYCMLSIGFILRFHPGFNYKNSFGGILMYMPSDDERRKLSSQNVFSRQCTLMCGLVCATVMSAIFIIERYAFEGEIMTHIWRYCLFLLELSMLLSVLVQFYLISHKTDSVTEQRKVDMSELFLILGTAGTIAFDTMILLANQNLIFVYVTDIVFSYLQTLLIVYANRVQIKDGLSLYVYRISNLFLFMAICNLNLWVMDTFCGLPYITKEVFYELGTLFRVFQSILFPVVISNRFRCATDMYCLFNRARKV